MSDTVTCSHIGCREEVDPTRYSSCGSHHTETLISTTDEYSCGRYFCPKHLTAMVELEDDTRISVCDKCEDYLIDSDEWYKDPIEECLVKLNI